MRWLRKTHQEPERVPPGGAEAFDHAYGWLQDQLAILDEYDRKVGVGLGVQLAFTAAIIGGLGSSILGSSVLRYVVVAVLALALVASVAALLVRPNRKAPEPARYAQYAGKSAEEMKWLSLPAVLEAIRVNTVAITWKRRSFQLAVVLLGLIGLAVLGGKAFSLA